MSSHGIKSIAVTETHTFTIILAAYHMGFFFLMIQSKSGVLTPRVTKRHLFLWVLAKLPYSDWEAEFLSLSMMFKIKSRLWVACLGSWVVALFYSCQPSNPTSDPNNTNNMDSTFLQIIDPHSAAKPQDAVVKHLDLEIKVDFKSKTLDGIATYDVVVSPGANAIFFDTKGLTIRSVTDGQSPLEHQLGKEVPHLGQPLMVQVTPQTKRVVIDYATSPGAEALQWLDPSQTAGKRKPFLFTQSQAILARTWIPCQDSPGIRFTYNAKVQVPQDLMALMSATNPVKRSPDGNYSFNMAQPIPAYLMALAVGDLEFKSLGPRTGVYAEPSMLQLSTSEFQDMEDMLTAAESLYGAYSWERYDVIVLPPSFPFGGMENPRLTFATPTILAGDRSLTALIAHELAHSWSGNLVTNATWNDFWLNEGFTVYFERRIMEKLYGRSYADMLAILGYQDLRGTLSEMGEEDSATCLKLNLAGKNPDDGMNDIAYEKGYLFLLQIENAVGRERFDSFLNSYFQTFAFRTMTTEGFLDYLQDQLVKNDSAISNKIAIKQWVYSPGLPKDHVVPGCARFDAVDVQVQSFMAGTSAPKLIGTHNWTSHEWLHFLRKLPATISTDQMSALDEAFGFSKSGNSEIMAAWLEHVIRREYKPGYPALEAFLTKVGRRKFVRPLFKLLAQTESGMKMARKIYAAARPNYHAVTAGTVDEILGWKPNSNKP
jgi:leukotriene A-4 hydrolase/aminopeptidase